MCVAPGTQARQSISKGRLVSLYGGRLRDRSQEVAKTHLLKQRGATDMVIDASIPDLPGTRAGGMMNSNSENPNCSLEWWSWPDKSLQAHWPEVACLKALRDIRAGEELTWDYNVRFDEEENGALMKKRERDTRGGQDKAQLQDEAQPEEVASQSRSRFERAARRQRPITLADALERHGIKMPGVRWDGHDGHQKDPYRCGLTKRTSDGFSIPTSHHRTEPQAM
ncbi:MAG: SET domain-containing protein-lysine N-methyltransferase, partial [Miltoncostaeaceae bacterium]